MVNHRIALLASASQIAEIKEAPPFRGHDLIFANDLPGLLKLQADAYMDLGFKDEPGRIDALKQLSPKPIFINSVIQSVSTLGVDFIRFNGWPGFLRMPVLEAAASNGSMKKGLAIFGQYIVFVKDVSGLVNPRIISMIINEAYFVLAAGTSTRENIDMAMKLGTGYPMGPFEWSEKIGVRQVYALLKSLSASDSLYNPAPGMAI